MSFLTVLFGILALPIGFGAGTLIRGAFAWSRTTVTVLLLFAFIPWFTHHGQVLDALRFGAVQSQWTHPSAFTWVHGTGYFVAILSGMTAVLTSRRTRWALVFGPGLAFLATVFVTLPLAGRAVSEGYFLFSDAAVATFWVGTLATTGLLLGYCWRSTGFAPASPAATGFRE